MQTRFDSPMIWDAFRRKIIFLFSISSFLRIIHIVFIRVSLLKYITCPQRRPRRIRELGGDRELKGKLGSAGEFDRNLDLEGWKLFRIKIVSNVVCFQTSYDLIDGGKWFQRTRIHPVIFIIRREQLYWIESVLITGKITLKNELPRFKIHSSRIH